MSSGNQGQKRRNEGQGRQNGGSPGMKERVEDLGQSLREGTEYAADRLREGYGSAREGVAHRYRRAEGAVARNPTPSVLIGFGLGFGLGLALTAMLAREEEDTWASRGRSFSDAMHDAPDSLRRMTRRGVESVRDSQLAGSLQDSFQHLAESIRDLPSALGRMMPGR